MYKKNNPKIKSTSNVRIEGNIENESCATTSVYPKTVFKHVHVRNFLEVGNKCLNNLYYQIYTLEVIMISILQKCQRLCIKMSETWKTHA